MAAYSERQNRSRQEERDHAASIAPYLAMREFHLPGYTWCEDYRQYFRNTHPVFGIFCHDKRHPVGLVPRIFILIGSMAFGLAVTNFFVLYFVQNPQSAFNEGFVTLNVTLAEGSDATDGVSVSTGQLILWTAGAAVNSMFDLSVWYISACACCLPRAHLEFCSCLKGLGNYLVVFITIIVVAVSSFFVILRATLESDGEVSLTDLNSGGLMDDAIEIGYVQGIEYYNFLISWLITVAASLFVWYPILGTILFSGVVGCYRLPFLGGRPRDILVEEREREKRSTFSSPGESYHGRNEEFTI
jgi:uncharacterized membrane protein YwzB